MTRHNLLMVGSLVCIGVMGALQGLQGHGVGDFTALISLLGLVEHFFAGNTASTA